MFPPSPPRGARLSRRMEDEMDHEFRAALARRVREIREDLYGPHGAQFLADALGLPLPTWLNFERGVTIPAEVILQLIETIGVRPRWLLTGEGPKLIRHEAHDVL